jgi:hypothetical protein
MGQNLSPLDRNRIAPLDDALPPYRSASSWHAKSFALNVGENIVHLLFSNHVLALFRIPLENGGAEAGSFTLPTHASLWMAGGVLVKTANPQAGLRAHLICHTQIDAQFIIVRC